MRLYTTENCTRCPMVRAWLDKNNIDYVEVDMPNPRWMTELRINQVFVLSAPVLQTDDDRFFAPDDLFADGQLQDLGRLLRQEEK